MVKGNVLIVDDDPHVRRVLSEILTSIGGYRADCAVDGRDGLDRMKEDRYDMVFTDLTMPRISGIDFLREVKRTQPSVPVIVITGFPSINNAVNAMREGARDFITKPFKADAVISLAKKIIGEQLLYEKMAAGADRDATLYKLNSELFRSFQEIGVLQAISTELDGIFSNRDIYERLVEMISRLLMIREASFGIVENGSLRIQSAIGTTRKEIPVKGTLFEQVIMKKNYAMSFPGEANPHNEIPLASPFFSIPLTMNDEVYAVLSITDKVDGTAFTDYEISLALTFAKKAALRIENNALYELFYNNLVNTLKSLVASIEARDSYTKHHSERVTTYSLQIADVMGLSEDEKDAIRFGGFLHDIGKIGVRDTVLLKPGRLTDEEFVEIRLHPVIGDNIIKPIKFFPRERELIRSHHERFDGKGYPDGLKGEEIPRIVRIMKVADTYDAMTSSRPYRKALPHETAVQELKTFAGSEFDPAVVRAFFQTDAGKGACLGI